MKTLATWCLATATVLLLQGNAWALPMAGDDKVKLYDNPGHGTSLGGTFKVDVLGNSTEVDYISFCLERYETINVSTLKSSTIYEIDSVADYATNGGGLDRGAIWEDNEPRDYVSEKTKWVFWNYIQGTLDFSSTTDSNEKANAVQYAIWVLEEEMKYGELNSYGSLYTDLYNSWFPNSTKDYSIDGIVKVLNLSDMNGKKAQSQLIGEAAPVPEPTTMLLFGTGLIGLAGMARRRQKVD